MLIVRHLFSKEIAIEVIETFIEQDIGDRLGFGVDNLFDRVLRGAVLRIVHVIVVDAILAPDFDILLVFVLVDPLEKCGEDQLAVVFITEFLTVLNAFKIYSLNIA